MLLRFLRLRRLKYGKKTRQWVVLFYDCHEISWHISPSSFNSEQLGSVYLVKLDVDNTNPSINVMSGLSGSVEVKIGKQSVMRYFLDPIVKGFGESFKEK